MVYYIGSVDMLTEKQKRIIAFINNYYLVKGYSPSIRDICEGLNISSTSTVHGHLECLEKLGYIKKQKKHRGLLRF